MQEVILVNENDEQIGTMEKIAAHRDAILHRAFSVFIFNSRQEMLLQRRSLRKYHSAGLWTNACCSHPKPNEDTHSAAQRRLNEELGFMVDLEKIFDFVYKSGYDNGLTEYEFDHVFTGEYNGSILPNPDEVVDYCFMDMAQVEGALQTHPEKFTSWFHIAFPRVKTWLRSRQVR